MGYAVFFSYNNDKNNFKLPTNPEQIVVTSTQSVEKYEVLKIGQIAVPGNMELKEYSFECEFPVKKWGEYNTPGYTGFKINSKLYAEVHINSKNVTLHVSKKFISDNDIKNLNVRIVPDTHGWTMNTQVRIDENSNLDDYFDIIRRCYEGTKGEYEEKIHRHVRDKWIPT
jgi:predicted transport protein